MMAIIPPSLERERQWWKDPVFKVKVEARRKAKDHRYYKRNSPQLHYGLVPDLGKLFSRNHPSLSSLTSELLLQCRLS